MHDPSTIGCVAETMAHRVVDRLGRWLAEEPDALERHLAHLDGGALADLLRVTRPAAAGRAGTGPPHLGVVGVDHALERLVVRDPGGRVRWAGKLSRTHLGDLDDDDLIAASHYLPETLPGNVLG